jgi:sugar phosphate isomerase/epimerase
MDLSRRQFVGAAAGTAAGIAVGGGLVSSAFAADPPFVDTNDKLFDQARLSVQHFTVRDAATRLDNPTGIRGGFRGIFETIAAQGYKGFEFFNYNQGANGAITIPQIRELLDANGLVATGAHINASAFTTNATLRETEFERAAILGMKWVGTAGSPTNGGTVADWQATAELWNAAAERAKTAWGLQGIYHHPERPTYAFFTDLPDVHRVHKFLEMTQPGSVWFEMDIFWAYVGAAAFPHSDGTRFDPAKWCSDNRGRFRMFHFKNGIVDPAAPNFATITRVEDGQVDYVDFFTKVRGLSDPEIRWIVEQDTAPGGAANPGQSLVNTGTAAQFVLSRPYPDVKGSRGIGPGTDGLSSQQAEAYESTAEYGGLVDHINVYVERRSTAGWLVAGLYSDNNGHPGTLLSQATRGNLTKPGWNTVPIPAVTVEKGKKYWTAVQPQGGTLKIRTFSGGAGTSNSETGLTRGLDELPATWRTDTSYPNDGPLSAFAPLVTA